MLWNCLKTLENNSCFYTSLWYMPVLLSGIVVTQIIFEVWTNICITNIMYRSISFTIKDCSVWFWDISPKSVCLWKSGVSVFNISYAIVAQICLGSHLSLISFPTAHVAGTFICLQSLPNENEYMHLLFSVTNTPFYCAFYQLICNKDTILNMIVLEYCTLFTSFIWEHMCICKMCTQYI